MTDFSLVDWDNHDEEANTKSSDATAGPEIVDGLGSCLQATTEDEDDRSEKNCQTPAEIVTGRSSEHGAEEGAACEKTNHDTTVVNLSVVI